ncbi:1-aminocyclopropane-1-carboxylate synthase-like protein 1 [Mizuhopecten yessoensis]|uniref:1-aminocyclopropane-1-carboxylate synthase-like protein 1 n=1 Tax=Mizuhopecten yessoensis TaxID=6573 RepID=A0A210PYN7_MIZYE|nr:1-aminocyclopropane-1-carboxylate synthase-like protein 1 [Mizuhopecten yessoensis]OWF41549.1 1-aminocyclopropane-1-carboxylate synthase-like protein 1 [Mizuhopecten yessoensis]
MLNNIISAVNDKSYFTNDKSAYKDLISNHKLHLPNMAGLLSKRANKALGNPDFLVRYLLEALGNAYDLTDNPGGIVNLGTVENKTCEDIWLKKVEELAPSIVEKSSLYYYNLSGLDTLRRSIGEFLATKLELPKPLDPEKIILLDGVTAILNAVALAIADEGDTILCPTPSFGRFLNDIGDVAGVRFYKVPMFEECDTGDAAEFHISIIEKYYKQAVSEGHTVKGVILCNPQNPTGKVYTKADVSSLLDFCASKEIHIIVDEIYALSCYDKPQFTSVLQCDIPDPNRTHFLWGFSKDLSLSGYRCGMIYTPNTQLLDYLRKVSMFCTIPAPVQIILNGIISDTEWLDTVYFPIYQKRLRENFEIARAGLEKLGIPVYKGTAGNYIWMKLTKYLPNKTTEEEIALFQKILQGGVYLCPGSEMFCHYPGWFRLTFTTYKDHVIEGLKRMEHVLSTC